MSKLKPRLMVRCCANKEFTAYLDERLANFACILKNIKKYFLSQDDAPIDNVLVENMFSMVPLEQCKWL